MTTNATKHVPTTSAWQLMRAHSAALPSPAAARARARRQPGRRATCCNTGSTSKRRACRHVAISGAHAPPARSTRAGCTTVWQNRRAAAANTAGAAASGAILQRMVQEQSTQQVRPPVACASVRARAAHAAAAGLGCRSTRHRCRSSSRRPARPRRRRPAGRRRPARRRPARPRRPARRTPAAAAGCSSSAGARRAGRPPAH